MAKRKAWGIVLLVVLCCVVMGVTDAAIKPGYLIKSAIKLPLFLLLPMLYAKFAGTGNIKRLFAPQKSGLKAALLAGAGLYALILAAYCILKDVFDFSAVTASLNENAGVGRANFVWVALYISFVNSLLEEFFFRGFAFLSLKETASRGFAYAFSSTAFALYHVAMMIGWFDARLIALAVAGLAAGGAIFDFCNEKSGNIYMSWIIHMSANFAINTIGFMLFEMI